MTAYLPILIAMMVAVGFVVVVIVASSLVVPMRRNAIKNSPYECGIEPVGDSWQPFAVRYYLFALLFLVFDVEAIFLFPWALTFRRLGTSGFVEVLIFIAVLLVGLVYAWRKGALEWV